MTKNFTNAKLMVKNFTNENVNDHFSLEELAEKVNLSNYYFCTIFKQF